MRRAARSLFASALFLGPWGCLSEPVYVTQTGGGGQSATSTTATGTPTSTATSSSSGGGGEGPATAPAPEWCNFYGGAGNEILYDARPAPNGTDIVVAGSFQGTLPFNPLLSAPGDQDGFLARLGPDAEVMSTATLGASITGVLNSAIVASQTRLVGIGQYRGTVGPYTSDASGNLDLIVFDFDAGAILAAGTEAEDGAHDGSVSGTTFYIAGDADQPGINFGIGPMASPGYVALMNLETNQVTHALPLGAGSSAAGSGHMVRPLADGSAWASVNLGGPGVTDIVCGGNALATDAARQPALLKIGADGVCQIGRLLPPAIIEDADLVILEGTRPALSGAFNGSMTIDGLDVSARGANPDAFFAAFDEDGIAVSLSSYGGVGEERPNEAFVSSTGEVFVTGEFSGTMLVGDYDFTSFGDGELDVFLLKLAPTGGVVWATAFPGAGAQRASALTQNGEGHLYLGGYSSGSMDCADPAPVSAGGLDMFLMRFEASSL